MLALRFASSVCPSSGLAVVRAGPHTRPPRTNTRKSSRLIFALGILRSYSGGTWPTVVPLGAPLLLLDHRTIPWHRTIRNHPETLSSSALLELLSAEPAEEPLRRRHPRPSCQPSSGAYCFETGPRQVTSTPPLSSSPRQSKMCAWAMYCPRHRERLRRECLNWRLASPTRSASRPPIGSAPRASRHVPILPMQSHRARSILASDAASKA
jgi:hypothetical protein